MLLFILFIVLANNSAFSQINISTKLEKSGFLDCSSQSLLLVDSSAKIPLQAILQQPFSPIQQIKIPKSLESAYRYDFWLKFIIKNPTSDTLDLLFTTGLHQSTQLFQLHKNRLVKVSETNEKLLPNQRLFRSDDQYIPVRFLPNQVYVFFAKINDYPRVDFNIRPLLVSYQWENYHKVKAFYDEYVFLIAYGLIIPILFFVALFVIIFYLLDRQIYYLYYAFYTISIGLFNLWEYEHSPYTHLVFSYLTFLKFTGNSNIYVFLTHIFYFLFIFEFLELKKKSPTIATVFRSVIISLSAILLADIIILFVFKRLDWSTSIYWTFQDIFPFLNVGLLIMIFQTKGRIVRNIQIGSTFLMIGGFAGFMTHYTNNISFVLFRVDPSILFVVGTLMEIFFFSIAIGIRSYTIQKEQKSLYKSIMESELRMLRSQINPHFVFNSLNSIKSYILTHRSTEASEYLTDFSTLMRSILQYSKEQLISLCNELETTLLYVSLEQRRFNDDFKFIYQIEVGIDTDEIMIPPMLLQPYIENAIKHGLMNKEGVRTLTLSISKQITPSRQIIIIIDDNGIGREKASLLRKNTPKHQSMGMSINDERISLLGKTNDFLINIKIVDKKTSNQEAEGTKVIIRIPTE
ncbi:hypothetical protein EMA8858_00649 [Emticicia aquatica]|uniref:7TM diverse intracellular signalling n=1 Tax=Emticicia aquatica TaxID=1681835 RepID=A0ABN8ENT3_9BACT|nr:hypothetical protein EMA8858_00649 [Emticicia aquatica]